MQHRICISGANSQVGSYLAHRYHEDGYPLLLLYHERSNRISDLLSTHPAFRLDLCDNRELTRILDSFHQSINILIHLAAVRSYDAKPVSESDPAIFSKVFEANFYPAYYLMRYFGKKMQEAAFGRMVFYTSDVTRYGLPNGAAYAAAKAAISNLAKSVGKELAKSNVTVNCIAPGPVDTVLEEDFEGDYLEFRKQYFAEHIKKSPVSALVSMKELKAVTDLLINPNTKSLCCEEIYLSGGIS